MKGSLAGFAGVKTVQLAVRKDHAAASTPFSTLSIITYACSLER
jgi:hypothetical protein